MTWRRQLDGVLDQRPAGRGGPLRVDGEGGAQAEVDVRAADGIGVRVRSVRLRHASDRDVAQEADRLGREVRSLPDRVAPVEVDPALGGAILRSRPDEMREREFYEVQVEGARDVEVRKVRVDDAGERQPAEWDVTREQLGRLLGELDGRG